MSESEEIIVEEENSEGSESESEEKISTEEIKVKGEELVDAVKGIVSEAGVRRVVVKYKDGRTLVEIPMIVGLAGIVLLPTWSALALIAALVTECSIVVERAEKEPEDLRLMKQSEEESEEATE